MNRTYLNLKLLYDRYLKKIKNDNLRIIIGALFLTETMTKFRQFYASHYLREILCVSKIPNFEVLLKTITNIYKGNIEIDFDNAEFIIVENSESLNIDIHEESNVEIDGYLADIQDPNLIVSKDNMPGEEEVIKVINKMLQYERLNNKNYSTIKYRYSEPNQEVFDNLKEYGYAVVPNFLSDDALNEMQLALNRIATRERQNHQAYLYGKEGKNQRIYNLLSKDQCFRDFLDSNYMDSLLEKIFYRQTFHEKYGLSSMAAHIIPPGGEAIPLHIDSVVPDPIPKWMIRFIVIITLTDFKRNNGSSAVIPGTHKLCRKPTLEDIENSKKDEIILEAPAGSLVMWDGLLWHRSTDNNSKDNRDSIIVSYAASFFKEICGEEEHLVSVPADLKQKLSPRIQSLIGMNRGIKKGADAIYDGDF
jgi:ectoine hydroxylase-related dioxygenase (phytanoyl-CoA dioxygenase family)